MKLIRQWIDGGLITCGVHLQQVALSSICPTSLPRNKATHIYFKILGIHYRESIENYSFTF